MISRLREFEKGIAFDKARAEGLAPARRPAPPGLDSAPATLGPHVPPEVILGPEAPASNSMAGQAGSSAEVSQSGSTGKPWVDLGPLREAMRDPREQLMTSLEKLQSEASFPLPAAVKERVAPGLLVQIYSKAGTAVKFGRDWIRAKELEKNHMGHEMLLHCMTLDRMIRSNPDFITSEGCEIMCSRIYALRRALRDVQQQADWKQPKGQNAAKCRSKVRWTSRTRSTGARCSTATRRSRTSRKICKSACT